ncbi:MAG: hypothetical protein HRT38_06920 [Alteromonadaceae bacterium]|nr:hypothetical protein [Alteromonadaceae bacterium]
MKEESLKLSNRQRKLDAEVEVKNKEIKKANASLASALQNIQNENEKITRARQKNRKEVAVAYEEIQKAEHKLNGVKQETNEIIDIYFYPFVKHFENVLSNLTPNAIIFFKERYQEFDEKMVKFNDKIPEQLPDKIRSEIKNVLSM